MGGGRRNPRHPPVHDLSAKADITGSLPRIHSPGRPRRCTLPAPQVEGRQATRVRIAGTAGGSPGGHAGAHRRHPRWKPRRPRGCASPAPQVEAREAAPVHIAGTAGGSPEGHAGAHCRHRRWKPGRPRRCTLSAPQVEARKAPRVHIAGHGRRKPVRPRRCALPARQTEAGPAPRCASVRIARHRRNGGRRDESAVLPLAQWGRILDSTLRTGYMRGRNAPGGTVDNRCGNPGTSRGKARGGVGTWSEWGEPGFSTGVIPRGGRWHRPLRGSELGWVRNGLYTVPTVSTTVTKIYIYFLVDTFPRGERGDQLQAMRGTEPYAIHDHA